MTRADVLLTSAVATLCAMRPADADRMRRAVAGSRRRRFAPAPRLTPSQWIERHRYLSTETAAEPGRYSFARAPYLREIADAMGSLEYETVVIRKPSQTGYTELLNSFIAFCAVADPSGMLMIQPTVDLAKAWTKERLKPMIRDTPLLRALTGEASGRRESDDTLQFFGFPGGWLAMQGANSPGGLASRPVRRVLADEVGRWPASAGKEGDPFALAETRTRTFWNRTVIAGSSPGEEGTCRITSLLETTDMRRRHVQCKACPERFPLDWRDEDGEYLLRCDKGADGEWRPETAFYACPHCGTAHTDADKQAMDTGGQWIASVPEVQGRAGFHIDGLLSPWLSWPDVLRMFQVAKSSMDTLRVFINTVVGLPFAPPSERISATGLMARAEPMGELPSWVGAVTVGCDVQADRFELLPVGFGAGERCAMLPPERIFGAIDSQETLNDVVAAILRPRSGMVPSSVCIDTGYRPEVAWAIVDMLRARRVHAFGVKGMEDRGSIISEPSSKGRKGVRNPWLIGSHVTKDSIDARFRADPDGPKGVVFSDGIDAESFAQLTAEEKRLTIVNGRPRKVWRLRPGMRNEMLDMFQYALGALHARGVRLINSLPALAAARAAPVPQADDTPSAPLPPAYDPVAAAVQRALRRPTKQRGFMSNRR
jgi:phage terminase large subunit GpA-like protein